MSQNSRIALIIDAAAAPQRAIVRGIAEHARTGAGWSFILRPPDTPDLIEQIREADCAGAIAQVADDAMARQLIDLAIPVVNVDDRGAGDRLPTVRFNSEAIGQLAFEHLTERGLERLAYVGRPGTPRSDAQGQAFIDAARRAGMACQVYLPPDDPPGRWLVELTHLARWLVALDKPVGVFACCDERARDVLDAAGRAPARVPDDLAVLGVNDDALYHGLTTPPLSSVRVPGETAGRRAAALLADLMRGKPAPTEPIELDPVGVSARQSSDIMALADPEVGAAVRYIRDNASRPIQVGDVLDAVTISRRSLERRFQQQIGRSPQAEIQRMRLQLARSLLAETDLAMPDIARRSGFKNADRLAAVFRQVEHTTPSHYRKQYRRRR